MSMTDKEIGQVAKRVLQISESRKATKAVDDTAVAFIIDALRKALDDLTDNQRGEVCDLMATVCAEFGSMRAIHLSDAISSMFTTYSLACGSFLGMYTPVPVDGVKLSSWMDGEHVDAPAEPPVDDLPYLGNLL